MAKTTDTKTKTTAAKKTPVKKAPTKKAEPKKIEVPKVDPQVELYKKEAHLYRTRYNALIVVIAILLAAFAIVAFYFAA